jgi:hypothetical protein
VWAGTPNGTNTFYGENPTSYTVYNYSNLSGSGIFETRRNLGLLPMTVGEQYHFIGATDVAVLELPGEEGLGTKILNGVSGIYNNYVDPAFVWINENINPLTPIVELVLGKEYSKDGFVQPKSRITSAAQTMLMFIPGGRVAGAGERVIANSAAKGGSRAFFSGAGTEAQAIEQGFQTLGQTRAGQNLANLTAGMDYFPGSQAYNMWGRLSATYAMGIPKGSTVNVFLNNPSPTGIWNAIERPILEQRGINIIFK